MLQLDAARRDAAQEHGAASTQVVSAWERCADEAVALLNAIEYELVPGFTGPAPTALVEQLEDVAAAPPPRSTPVDMEHGSAGVVRLRGGCGSSPEASPPSKRQRQSATDPPPPQHLPWADVGELRDGDVISYNTGEDDAPWIEGEARVNPGSGKVTITHRNSSKTSRSALSNWNADNYNVNGEATSTSLCTMALRDLLGFSKGTLWWVQL